VNEVPQESPSEERELGPGDVVALRKPHPCGSKEWEVERVGADIRLKCIGCGHEILLPRHEFRTRLHHIVRHHVM
jgi:hypothetical protein